MELTLEQIEMSKRIKTIKSELDEISYELKSTEMDFYNENEKGQKRLLGVCEYLDSKAFSLEMESNDLIEQLNNQGITLESHPNVFPLKKITPKKDNSTDDLPF